MALLTEDDVMNMRFKEPKEVSEGYDQDEVDVFLDQVADTIGALTKENAELQNQLKVAQARVTELEGGTGAPVDEAPDSATSTSAFVNPTNEAEEATGLLMLAQELRDRHIAEGKAESERLVSEAQQKSQQMVDDAQDQYNRTMAQLEQERSLMERKISELRDFERDYRTRLKSYLESLLSNVESGSSQTEGFQN
ncbi:MAG: DivIVA domain-containing protein [Ancrocorticia sp.]|jgi:DivIVA domain-containing protein|nr:DivIVA domain-containing protein [Ancrocorticia sp.]MCI1895324.1 DivIVA domain-containing protein [Ancrocorticia sp.]MCI1932069.1 DivIVA domain-containing protein [Ancrocorticia sp.]MCI1963430.1 DivIVA domain-containing protein [Ancrocorticia sp.]MCI2002376.1 DivIVA domain-containing protein [Ancrocorticia sp.]